MRNRLVIFVLFAGVFAGATIPALASHNGNSRDSNVPICHKGRTIHVSPRAIPGHLRHGDTTGPCQVATPTATPTTAIEATPTDTPAPLATPTEPSEPEATPTDTAEPEVTPTDTVEPTPNGTPEGAVGLRFRGRFAALRFW